MLVDANVLIALVNRRDQHHTVAVNSLSQLALPLYTTWPCLTEAIYIAYQLGGFDGQKHLFGLLQDGVFGIHNLSDQGLSLCEKLMQKYTDLPMDFADATLCIASQERETVSIFSFDHDFDIYRLPGGRRLRRIPAG